MKLARIPIYLVASLAGLYLLAAALYAIPMISGALDDRMAVRLTRPDPSIISTYSNGLSNAQKQEYYHLTQGAEILPWILFTAVDVADAGSDKPFAENLERFGLLPDPTRDDGLPVGLTVSSNPFTFGMDFVGVTCAACHVGELRSNGKAVRIDGAPNMINLQLFYGEAVEALSAILRDRSKLWRALKRMGRQDYERYRVAAPFIRPASLAIVAFNLLIQRDARSARFELIQVIQAARKNRESKSGSSDARSPEPKTSGFGRLDAFDGTRNFLFARLRKTDEPAGFEVNRKNMVRLDAAVKFPPLWSRKAATPKPLETYLEQTQDFPQVEGFKDYAWLEWTLNTNTVMERNFTETLGAGATVVLDPASTSLFESSIPIRSLHKLEWLSYYIDPPTWPAAAFGPVAAENEDKEAVLARGESIFKQSCAGCHDYGEDRRTPEGLLVLDSMSLDAVGTDVAAALNIICPVPDPGALDVKPRTYTADEIALLKHCAGTETETSRPFARTVQTAVNAIKRKAYAAAGINEVEQRAMEDLDRRKDVRWRDTQLDAKPPAGPYAARPLHGIWAAAPYLHNGSVPTLYDLLQPPDKRPKSFALGTREYDTKKLGFVVTASCDRQDCLVDTTLPGNSNSGHLWGTGLGEADRMALLSYLKTY